MEGSQYNGTKDWVEDRKPAVEAGIKKDIRSHHYAYEGLGYGYGTHSSRA